MYLGVRRTRVSPLTDAAALLLLLASFGFVSWIAAVQYNGEPHIYDASAYLFAAKMYAQGHLAVPIPPASDRFPGPFLAGYAAAQVRARLPRPGRGGYNHVPGEVLSPTAAGGS